MTEGPSRLERFIEAVLVAGVLASGSLMLLGLAFGWTPSLRWGVVLLMLTPVARVVVVTLGLALQRDWAFALISLWVLAVLASSGYVAARVQSPPQPPPALDRRA